MRDDGYVLWVFDPVWRVAVRSGYFAAVARERKGYDRRRVRTVVCREDDAVDRQIWAGWHGPVEPPAGVQDGAER